MVAHREPIYYGYEEQDMSGIFNDEWERPTVVASITPRFPTAEGTVYVTIGFDEHRRIREVFIRTGKMGETRNADMVGLGRTISYALQVGGNPLKLIGSLEGITSTPVWHEGVLIKSVEDGVAKELRKVIEGHYDQMLSRFFDTPMDSPPEPTPIRAAVAELMQAKPVVVHVGDECVKCGGRAVFQEGCMTCLDCNYSKCG